MIGQEVAGYRLEAQLGAGSAGHVWRATNGEHTVAVKLMNPDLLRRPDAKQHRRRLHYEVTALMRLRDYNVPAVHCFEVDGAHPYVVMQYIEGESYDRLIASGAMFEIPLKDRFKAICMIALTLTRAHHLGIIHRDIKPANLKGFDPPYLLDFGIAISASAVATARDDIGTGAYMPPAGEPLDKLSDLYSFAIVVYEMLFGQHPLFIAGGLGETVLETRQRAADLIARDAWQLPSRIAPERLPDDLHQIDLTALDAVFRKALGARSHRYKSLAPFLRDLRDALGSRRAEPLQTETQELMIHRVETMAHTDYPEPDLPQMRLLIGAGVVVALVGFAVLVLLLVN